jgi:hypothetical protein
MTLQRYFDNYLFNDTDGDYDDRYDNARTFVCDAQEHHLIIDTIEEICSFANKVFNVELY